MRLCALFSNVWNRENWCTFMDAEWTTAVGRLPYNKSLGKGQQVDCDGWTVGSWITRGVLGWKEGSQHLRLYQSYLFLIRHHHLNMSLLILLLWELNNGGWETAASCGVKNCMAPEESVQPEGRAMHGIASLRNPRFWWRSRSLSDNLRCLHAVECVVWSQSRTVDSGLFFGKLEIWTALDAISLI